LQKNEKGITLGLRKKSFYKDNQEKFPMQIPYHIKVDLQEYYEKFNEWPVPNFSDKCPICGGIKCARYLGCYLRTAICPLTGVFIPDLPVLRFVCSRKGTNLVCYHVTFSLLPLMLVPYRKLSLKFMVQAIYIRLSRKLSLTNALDAIETELNHLGDIADFINISSVLSWEWMLKEGAMLLLWSKIDLASVIQYEQLLDPVKFSCFLETVIHHKTRIGNHTIRGPDAFAFEFYQQSGGTERCAHFLFGLASQHRL